LASSNWPKLKPFALTSQSQFRPEPPIALTSEQWAADYNEIKDLGGKDSTKRSAQQTEDGRFWLITGPQSADPIVRQVAMAHNAGRRRRGCFLRCVCRCGKLDQVGAIARFNGVDGIEHRDVHDGHNPLGSRGRHLARHERDRLFVPIGDDIRESWVMCSAIALIAVTISRRCSSKNFAFTKPS
jgi:hypothetical protein